MTRRDVFLELLFWVIVAVGLWFIKQDVGEWGRTILVIVVARLLFGGVRFAWRKRNRADGV